MLECWEPEAEGDRALAASSARDNWSLKIFHRQLKYQFIFKECIELAQVTQKWWLEQHLHILLLDFWLSIWLKAISF